MRTIGISPKVFWPALVNFVTGFGLVIAGLVAGQEPIWGAGLGLLTGGTITGALGGGASPGTVDVDVGPASDSLLDLPEAPPG